MAPRMGASKRTLPHTAEASNSGPGGKRRASADSARTRTSTESSSTRRARHARLSRGTRAARRGSANIELRSSRWPRPRAKPARPSAASPHSTRAVHYPRRRAPVPDHPLSPLRQLGARRHAAWLLQPIGMPARRVVAATERRRRNRPPFARGCGCCYLGAGRHTLPPPLARQPL